MARRQPQVDVEPVTASWDSGEGESIVLLHGINSSWRVWRPVIPLLGDGHRVFAPTVPGHRGGTALAGASDVPAIADALERGLDEAGVEKAHLVGNSLGGWLALELAARGRATSVVAFSPAGCWGREKDIRRLTKLLQRAKKVGAGHAAEVIMRRPALRRIALRPASVHGDRIPPEEVEGMLLDLRACTVLEGILEGLRRDGPVSGSIVPTDVPTRVAWPDKDRTIPFDRYGAPLVAAIPHVDLVRLPGVGHVPMYDDPALIARTVLEFVAAHPAA